jgi:ATP-dependent Lon protease
MPNGRCRLHGGMSPGAPKGNKNALKHGRYTAEAIARGGPRGTGKSHLFQQVSPYAHLISGGKATVARMFVNNANGQRRLVCQYDVVCFDEISGVSFDQKDGVNIMKGYMESGEFSRRKESIRADGGV